MRTLRLVLGYCVPRARHTTASMNRRTGSESSAHRDRTRIRCQGARETPVWSTGGRGRRRSSRASRQRVRLAGWRCDAPRGVGCSEPGVASLSAPRLALATLYSSAEPCAMCAGAVYWSANFARGIRAVRGAVARADREPSREPDAVATVPGSLRARPATHRGDRARARRRGGSRARGVLEVASPDSTSGRTT